ncbi:MULTISPECIES: DUF2339 domain-containing protein [unclassified Acinetobacter]|uniref:DUF2339 domain-containing protein n=1 Tax=unclassified Acinetobacter TaxID=196816 RepID=UPI0019092B44|nr:MULTISPECIES: DUF2339 domain-containing protein [unclassified Acinetobacter]MBK0064577.1 DUF2339 domain-containing protein [Acinetobacter sp. S55]MBK0067876.1 DUF2339 domain-containing protein [Acinetobacter sp. S54]
MYKNDKQNITMVIIIFAIGLLGAFVFEIKNAVILLVALLVFAIVQQFTRFDRRIQQLERQYNITAPKSSMHLPQWAIYLGTLIGITGYYWHTTSAIFVGIGLVLFSLIQMFSFINERLQNIEDKKQIHPLKLPRSSEPVAVNHQMQLESENPDGFPSQQGAKILSEPANDQTDHSLPLNSISQKQAWWQPALDWLIHGNPILRVAIAILMIGVVLLLRFASEHWQLSLGIKLLGIAITGGALTALGYYLKKNNALFAVALQGAGLAIIFMTLIFAHHYTVIASLGIASSGFAVLLMITVALSLKQNAVYLSMLALSMAYLAPLLIPQYHPDSIFLFSYYLLINVAVAAMNFIKPWKILNQIAFFASGLLAGSVIVLYANSAQYHTLDIILWLHIALFIWLSVRYSQLIQKEYPSLKNQSLNEQQVIQLPPLVDVGLIFSVPIFGFSLHAFLVQQSSLALTCGAALLGITYAVLGWWIRQKQSELSILAKSFFILAVAFIALIFPLYQGAHWTAIGWVVQGTALIVWGVSERYRLSRYLGIVLVILSSLALFYQVWSDDHFPVLSTSIYAISQFISAYFLFRSTSSSQGSSVIAGSLFLSLALYSGAVAGVEFLQLQGQGLSPYLAIAALLCFGFTVVVYWRARLNWHIPQLVILSILIVLSFVELTQQGLLAQLYWISSLQQISFLIAAITLSLLLLMIQKIQRIDSQLNIWWAGLVWLSLAIMGPALWSNAALLSFAVIPVLYSIWLFKNQQYLLLDQLSVWILSWFWLVAASLSDQVFVAYYLPVVNPADVLSLLVLLGVLWIIYHHDFATQTKAVEWRNKIISIVIALLVFSSVVVRALHFYAATPLWSWAIWSNGTVQLSLTLLWVVLAFVLMTFSSQRQIRQLWFVGAALLAIVVIKLVGLDLSQSGTLTRVISFIGAGGVMLVIAYLAPLPPVQSIQDTSRK